MGVIGFLITSRALPVTLFALLFAAVFLGTGLSRLVHAAGLRRLSNPEGPPQLDAGKTDFIKPARSIFETDELAQPMSVTERTTTHLKIDQGSEG